MTREPEVFWDLGTDARGAPLPPPFREAREAAWAIYDDLTEVGLSPQAIRKVACALLGVSPNRNRSCNRMHARQTRGGMP